MNKNKLRLSTLLAALLLSSSISFAGVVEDTAITSAVKAKLLLEKDIPSNQIEVTTKDLEVFLKGTVATSLQADRIIELAASFNDVVDVDYTDLFVKNSTNPNRDSWISSKVKGRIAQLINNNRISLGYNLTTETNNKEVHIFGTVTNSNDIDTIVESVKKIKSVENVKTNIKVVK